MITKEQAQKILDECGYPDCQTTECELARTVIALWDRVQRLEKVGSAALKWSETYRWAAPWADEMNAILKETTND